MTAAFTERDWQRIERAAFEEFVTYPVAAVPSKKRDRFRRDRTQQVQYTVDEFRVAMESDKPPQSKDEAIRQVVGLIGKLLAFIFPQYALLISIIGFLWDVSTGQNVTIAGEPTAEAHN